MNKQNGIREVLRNNPIVPVVNISNPNEVKNIIDNLISKNISCIEITLRNESAFDCIDAAIKQKPDGFSVGAGTITNPDQLYKCETLNVDFVVSPGFSNALADAFNRCSTPFLPGVMTPSEIIQAKAYGWNTLKLFPANLAGGIEALNTYKNVFSVIQFCPTGGLNETNYTKFLELENVICVGGSWIMK
ncbi:MAG: bifunctional 4-hydroxy-2-oxoglutarate aldolase/2-dehydro-3-deoxy-phosphogluconate aldolase [Flavobacteriales bacterium]|nr:bifunctional 4-hydroxy-2-oxoglutarate aldolase/2-dehydro-3-deoxy-phosphogluconate aldolase [Flavobacteriales bacterium]